MRRVLMLMAAVAIPVSGVFVALSGGQAWAKTKGPNGKVTCTSLSGTVSGTVTASGCSDTGSANTGTSSEPIPATAFANGGTVTWVNGKTTTFAKPGLVSTSAKKCPGYVKGASSEPSAEKFSGAVTADTSGLKVPGKYKGAVCISQSGNITALKPLKAS
jgi:hypothetical protein